MYIWKIIILIYKFLAPPRIFHDNYSRAYGAIISRTYLFLSRRKKLLIAMLLQTIPLTHIMEKTLNGDGLTDPSDTVNFFPPYLLISLCWRKIYFLF
jgi:hypothetical protein